LDDELHFIFSLNNRTRMTRINTEYFMTCLVASSSFHGYDVVSYFVIPAVSFRIGEPKREIFWEP
jgi:hypothetical protein